MPDAQVFSDRYEMVSHIARGGMAQVYLARDLLLDRPVALKVLFPELSVDQAFVERFRREAKRAANLSHPNIVSIYDWGQGEHTYYMVMEYIDGKTLSSMLKEGPLEASRAASIGADVAAALEFAHRHGVIHRDVKPGNVLIDSGGLVKVADFGIARAVDTAEDLTQTGSVMGTATYFSPEQAQGQSVDARSDVYSLGIVLYEMVGGKPPFSGDSPVSIAYKHVTEVPKPPSSMTPEVPGPFEAIVMKAISKNPDDRYQTAGDLRADLARFASGQPVTAFDPTRASPSVAMAGAPATTVLKTGRRSGRGETTRVMSRAGGTAALPATTIGGGLYGAGAAGPPGGRSEPGGSRAGFYSVIALILIAALGAGAFFGGRSLGLWDSSKNITIPSSVVGEPAATAEGQLAKLGFTDVTERSEASTQYKVGYVAGTSPSPGKKVRYDSSVVLLVSSGPSTVALPSVAGDPLQQAEAMLSTAGFKVGNISYQASANVADGDVISTNPAGAQQAAPGSTVAIVVSNGKPTVTVPSLMNQLPGPAAQELNTVGLKVASQLSEPSSTIPDGYVTRTSPPANSTVPAGTSVTIYVSSGPPVPVPNLIGDTEAQAQAALTQANLLGSFSTTTVTNPLENGLVLSQNPAFGSSVGTGTTVDVVIGTYSATTTTLPGPSTTTSTTSATTGNNGGGNGGLPGGFGIRRGSL